MLRLFSVLAALISLGVFQRQKPAIFTAKAHSLALLPSAHAAPPHAAPAKPSALSGDEDERPGDETAALLSDFHGSFAIIDHLFGKVVALSEEQAQALHGKAIAYVGPLVTTPWLRCQVERFSVKALTLKAQINAWGSLPALTKAQSARLGRSAPRYQGQVRRIEVHCQGDKTPLELVQTAPDTVVSLHDGVIFVAKRGKK